MTELLGRRTFLSGAIGAASGLAQTRAQRRPNILMLITDQQSNGALSANGNPYLRTPAMDSLCANGVSFSESYCTYPVCSPSRSSLFTSRMPHETGVRVNGMAIAKEIPTSGEVFREAGYQTAYAGKWHLPKSHGNPVGFDDLTFERLNKKGSPGALQDEPVADASINFLKNKPKQPFFLVASFLNPHDVCDWIREHPGSRTYDNLEKFPPAPANMAVDPDEPEYMQYHRTAGYDRMSEAVGIASKWNRDDVRYYLHSYYRLIEDVDRQIGRVLEALRRAGIYDNTLIVLTTDHGEGMGAHRWVQKAAFWEETAKVPLVIAGAGVERTGVREQRSMVSGLDVFPTLCDYAGIAAPPQARGRSLRGAIRGTPLDRPFVVMELSGYGGDLRQGRMLRTSRYKYVVFNGGARPEQLFDLQLDPGEVMNLARRKDAAGVLEQHKQLLAKWIETTKDDFRKIA